MTTLAIIFGALVLFGIVAEIVVSFSGRLFSRLAGEHGLNDAIAKTRLDIEESRKTKERLQVTLRPFRDEYSRHNSELREIVTEIEKRGRPADILVFTAGGGPVTGSGRGRFRASLSKQLQDPPDPQQVTIWGHPCIVEIAARDVDQALGTVMGEFPLNQGYSIGLFDTVPEERAS